MGGQLIATHAPVRVEMFAVTGMPLVGPGQDLAALIVAALDANGTDLCDDDIVVVAQKIVSKAEGRVVSLADVQISAEARERARQTDKEPALVQLILDESNEVLRQGHNVIIVEHRLGYVMANAGIDQSNSREGEAILLPEDPDASAERIAAGIEARTGRKVGVIVIDSIGRAWRNGSVGQAIGVARIVPLIDLRGSADLSGREMLVTQVAIADEIAAGASTLMGEGSEGRPVVIVRGYNIGTEEPVSVQELLRDKDIDLFR